MPRRPHPACGRARCAGGPRSAASTPAGPRAAARPASSSTRSTPSPPGFPRSWPATGPAAQPGGRGGEPGSLGVAPGVAVRHPHTGGHRILVHVQTRAAFDQRLHLLASSTSAIGSLPSGAASTRGPWVSCWWQQCGVPEAPTSAVSAGSRHQESGDVGPMTGTSSSVAGGRPRPWKAHQQSTAQRCADQRFPRSRGSVSGEGMRS
jgi:hypothetical protein